MDDAKKYANKEIAANPDLEYGYLLMAEVMLKENNVLEGTNFYKKAQTINQNSVDALMGMAFISLGKNNFDSALDLYNKAAKSDPNNAIIRRQLGHVYKAMGQGMLAIESYKAYLDLAPDAKDKGEITAAMKRLE
jgi:tetratricopeptide (TPR) repeat protein